MSEVKFTTDLSSSISDIIVLQPVYTAGMRSFEDMVLEDKMRGWESRSIDWNRHISGLTHQLKRPTAFVHFADLQMYEGKCVFEPCGNITRLWHKHEDQETFGFTCENCGKTVVFYHVKEWELPNILLHLLLKQMVPGLHVANYIWTPETGTVGVQPDVLTYKRPHDLSRESWRADLGFVLMPQMQTLEKNTGFEDWLRYLVQIKFDQLQWINNSTLPYLIGPKQHGNLSSYPRFWS